MVSRNADASPGESCPPPPQVVSLDRPQLRTSNTVFKSGPLLISSKGLGWTSWKKRWFILTRTSLVFFRSDPNALPQKGGEVNLTLGGIDLNNSGSVIVRADKKLLTVSFRSGGDGRGFTLKAETSEDLYEWKTALENALAQAPSANLVMGQPGIFQNDASDTIEESVDQLQEKQPVKSLVIGRPILLALEDIDGSPSFLEKALRFIEEYGIKVEGILRLAADVEEVERRVQEYEQGKTEFSPDEDAHVIGDCIKHVLRELPSSPVPASCCTALLEAYRSGPEDRVDAIHYAIFETFPEPNRRLLQRLLKMMLIVASHKSQNRMSTSAVAACMAPLLLRPLLAGECELDGVFGTSSDGSAQLMAAAAAANHAHAIVSTLMEEYDCIFEDDCLETGSHSSDMYSDSEGNYTDGSQEDEEILETVDNGYHDAENDLDPEDDPHLEDDPEEALSGIPHRSIGNPGSEDLLTHKVHEGIDSDGKIKNDHKLSSISKKLDERDIMSPHPDAVLRDKLPENEKVADVQSNKLQDSFGDVPAVQSPKLDTPTLSSSSCLTNDNSKSYGSAPSVKRPTTWGRTAAKKNLSMESIDSSSDDESAIQRLEILKIDLQNKIAKEEKENAILQASLERRKQALHERRVALEQDVARLQEQLQKERDLRAILEAGLNMAPGNPLLSSNMDSKTKAELEEIAVAEADVINLKQRVADLHFQLKQQNQQGYVSICESCIQHHQNQNHDHNQDIRTPSEMLNNETSQQSEDTLLRADSGSARSRGMQSLPSRKSSKKRTDFTSMSMHDSCPVKEATTLSEGPASTSSTLVELTSRLDLLKEKRSQLLNELQNLNGDKEKVVEARK